MKDEAPNHSIIPAQPGFFKLSLWEPNSEGKIEGYDRRPIIAWAIRLNCSGKTIEHDELYPIDLGGRGYDGYIECPDGSIEQLDTHHWDSIETWWADVQGRNS